MIRLRNTLVTNLAVMILLILVIGQGILYTWLLLYQKGYLEERLRDEVTATGRYIGEIAAMGHDSRQLDLFLSSLVKSGNILSIKITDREGKTVAAKTAQIRSREDGGINPFSMFYTPAVNVANVLVRADGETSGSVEIIYSGRQVNEVMKRFLIIPPVMQSITFLLIVFAIAKFFQRKVGIPVGRINKALSSVTVGDLKVDVPDLGNNEMGSIARGLRFLIERLSSSISRFNSISGNVAMAIEQLTVTLKNLNEAARRQARSMDDLISNIKVANDSQRVIADNTDKLSSISSENVSSLLEMKATAEEIASSTVRLFKSSEDSYAMIAEMSQTAKVIAESANEVSRAVEDTSSSVEEISASLNAVRDNTKKSAELASVVRGLLTDRGTLVVADAIDAMEKIVDEVNHSAEIITRLEERSKGIEKVLSVIKEVTEKTNLLSLNAAILAAQAGEYGKSFSVVADEIRSLSDRTSSSAKDIASIVRAIEEDIYEAVNAIKSGVGKVEKGKDLIYQAGEAIGGTLEAAQKSAQMAAVIEKATEEQAEGLRRITQSMENIRRMIEDMAKATEEQRKGSSHMLDSISDVKEVAEIVKRGTEEHASGTNLISRNIEVTSEMVSQINQSARNQMKVNEGIVAAVEQMRNEGISTIKDMEEVALSLNTLRDEIELLKREMEVFKTR